MAAAEIFIVLEIVSQSNYWAIIPMGCGGGLGAVFSMVLHKKIVKR